MNAAEQKRTQRAEQLRVFQTSQEDFWVESSDGKIAYRIFFNIERKVGKCTCPDYQIMVKSDGDYKCKHLLATAEAVRNNDTGNAEHIKKMKPKLDEKFIINIKGKDFCTYPGLLDVAHKLNLMSLKVELLQYPCKDNGHEAITKAVAETSKGEIYTDIGDASPQNCDSRIAKHLIRMSSTRSKSRVLRDLSNISMLAIEEVGDVDEVIGSPGNVVDIKSRKTAQSKKKTGSTKSVPAKNQSSEKNPDNGNGSDQSKISQAQEKAIMNLSKRRDISPDDLEKMSQDMFKLSVVNITTSDAASLIQTLQQSA